VSVPQRISEFMASQHFGYSLLLVAATIAIHGAGTLGIFWMLFRTRMFAMRHFGHVHNVALLTSVVAALLAVHLTEATCWAAFYSYKGFFSDFSTSLYFSIGNYTTVGYGDVVLHDKEWRLVGGVEALTGSLMLCWSTVILVNVLNKLYRRHIEVWEERESPARERGQRPAPYR
jgi:voltage-gated potassium channel